MNILNSLRNNITPVRNILNNSTFRGPKKKADKKGDGIVSEHILNIFKNQDDIPILPTEYYPPWVVELKKRPMRNSDFIINSLTGIYVSNHSKFFDMILIKIISVSVKSLSMFIHS